MNEMKCMTKLVLSIEDVREVILDYIGTKSEVSWSMVYIFGSVSCEDQMLTRLAKNSRPTFLKYHICPF